MTKEKMQELKDGYLNIGIEFINLEKFIEFLKDNLNTPLEKCSVKAFIDKVVVRHGETGGDTYELGSFYTKNKCPKCISYEYTCIWNDEIDCAEKEIFEF